MRQVLTAIAFLALAACSPHVFRDAGPRIGDTIREQESALADAVRAKNASRAASFYAPDAEMYNPGEEPHTNQDAIRGAFQQLFSDPNSSLEFHTENVILPSSGDYAISEGPFTITFTDPTTHQRTTLSGHYMTLWRHQADDSWKIMRDTSIPGPAPAPAPH